MTSRLRPVEKAVMNCLEEDRKYYAKRFLEWLDEHNLRYVRTFYGNLEIRHPEWGSCMLYDGTGWKIYLMFVRDYFGEEIKNLPQNPMDL